MPWSDKSVSPVIYTPGAGEMTLDSGLSIVGGKIVSASVPTESLIVFLDANSYVFGDSGTKARWNNKIGNNPSYFESTDGDNAKKPYLLNGSIVFDKPFPCPFYGSLAQSIPQPFTVIAFGYVPPLTGVVNVLHDQENQRILSGLGVATGSANYNNPQAYTATGNFSTPILTNPISMLTTVFNGSSSKIYINAGVLNGSGNVGTTGISASYPLVLFARYLYSGDSIRFSGSIKAFLIYSKELSPLELSTIYTSLLSFSTLSATLLPADAFQPTTPAKLATLPQATLTLDTTGAAGTVALYLQHYNDEVARWESYAGVADEWTEIGTYSNTTTIDLPTLPARAGEKVRVKLVFTSNDGTAPAPAFVSLSLSWTSDVTAPIAPTIGSILGVGGANALCNLGPVPAEARHIIAEVNVDDAGFVPLSKRNKIESGQGYLEFLGPQDAVEQSGGRNSVQVLVENLTLGQTVQVRAKAVDAVGNVSAATDSDIITIGGSLPQLYIEDAVVFSGGTANIRVHLVGRTDDEVTVDLATVEGTATDPEHFTEVSTTVTFESGSDELHRWVDVEINAIGSETILGTLTYSVELSNPVGALLERATGTVTVKGILVQRVPTHRMTFKQRAPMKLVWRQKA